MPYVRRFPILCLLFCVLGAGLYVAAPSRADDPSGQPRADERGRRVEWKLLFHQLFALEIRKEYGDEALPGLLREHTHYTPHTFNEVIDACAGAGSSLAAYETRRSIYEDPANRARIADFDLTRTVGAQLRANPAVAAYLDGIEANAGRRIDANENFFASPEGANAIAALTAGGDDVAFVLVPGYAAHTIKYYIFEEIVHDANAYYGRPAERPLVSEDGIDLVFEPHDVFYELGNDRPRTFDILHPSGTEMGNTTGLNAETTDLMAEWIRTLPAEYDDKKLILLGYSKGAPIVLDMVNRHPDLSERIIGYVTYAGVVQGTNVARAALEDIDELLEDRTVAEMIDRLREEDPDALGRILSPLFLHIDLSIVSWPRLREVFDVLGYDLAPTEDLVDRLLDGREVREIIDGAIDLSPAERVRWNLLHLDNDTFADPAFLFNLSAVLNIEDFATPRSLLAPQLTDEGELDFRQLSLDALFLYSSSIEGFKSAPGGLFDSQVELGNTKSPYVDARSLSESLTDPELEGLWADPDVRAQMAANGVTSFEQFASTPRRDLIRWDRRDHIDAIDLGEIRGHHWSLFVQALRPPPDVSEQHAVWTFPRKAYMRALLQTMALYLLIDHEGSNR